MSIVDILPIAVFVIYALLGFFSGAIRRIIGLVALYLAIWAATNMGVQAGNILQQSSNVETSDGKIYGFFGILLIVLVLVEVALQLGHSQIQLPALVLNRTIGLFAGLLTAFLLSVVLVYELEAVANPFGGGDLDALQAHVRDGVNGSTFAVAFVNRIDGPVIDVFRPVLPTDPQIYFGPGPVTP